MLPTQKTIYYSGSFDMPHNGHLSALQATMSATGATRAVVWANDEPNRYKPNILDWNLRIEMLIRMCKPFSNINVFKDLNKLKKSIQNDYVIILIGSDSWPRFSTKKINQIFKEVCVTRRDEMVVVISYPLPVRVITPPITNYSSTTIRKLCREATTAAEVGSVLEEFVAPEVKNYILDHFLYLNKRVISEIVVSRILNVLQKKYSEIPVLKLLNEDRQNISGDYPFKIAIGNRIFFGKAFLPYPIPSPKDRLDNEINGLENLKHPFFKVARAAKFIYSHHDRTKEWYLLLSSFLKGIEVECLRGQKQIEDAYSLLGKALYEIHSFKKIQSTPLRFEEIVLRCDRKVETCLEELSNQFEDIEIQTIKGTYWGSRKRFEQNPGLLTFIHGDANLSNFLIDFDQNIVNIVDFSRFGWGYPGEDAQHILWNLAYRQILDNEVTEETILSANRKFLESYRYQDLMTTDAWEFYDIYWTIRMIHSYKMSSILNLIDKADSLFRLLVSKYYGL